MGKPRRKGSGRDAGRIANPKEVKALSEKELNRLLDFPRAIAMVPYAYQGRMMQEEEREVMFRTTVLSYLKRELAHAVTVNMSNKYLVPIKVYNEEGAKKEFREKFYVFLKERLDDRKF